MWRGRPVDGACKINLDRFRSWKEHRACVVAPHGTGGSNRDADSYFVWYNRFGTGWGTPAFRVDDAAPYAVNAPDLALNASGTAVVTWAEADSVNNFGAIVANILPAGQVDWPRFPVGPAPGFSANTYAAFASSYPKTAIDAIGNIVVVWAESNGSLSSVWASRYAGGRFGATTRLSLAAYTADSPRIAMDASGNALVAWRQYDGTRNRIYATWFR